MTTNDESGWQPRDVAAVTALVDRSFPQARDDVGGFVIEELGAMQGVLRLPVDPKFIRPGGSISGPTMFKLADIAVWIVIMSERGPTAVDAVTSNMTINFLARPAPVDLICKTRILRLGRRLAIGDCEIFSEGEPQMVAHATATYAMPAG